MKFSTVITFIVLCCLNPLHAQDTDRKVKITRIWVSMYGEPSNTEGVLHEVEGALYQVNDSSILVSNSLKRIDYSTDSFTVASLNISDIETIKVRRKGSFGKRVLIGTISGIVIGGVIGFASGDDTPCVPGGGWCLFDFTAEEKAFMYGSSLGVLGAGIGAAVGSIKIKIPINRSMDQYNRKKSKLRMRAIKR